MQMRGVIRVLGGFMSFAAVVFGHRTADARLITTDNYSTNLKNARVDLATTGASLNWGCIPMISGVSQPGTAATKLECEDTTSKGTVVEYTDKTVPQGNVQSGYASVPHQYCLGGYYGNPVGGNYSRAWACFCNATGLCAPVKYLQHMGYSAGAGTYGTARYYTMAQWRDGVTATAASGTGTGTGVTGTWGGLPDGKSNWGRISSVNGELDGYVELYYPVEVFKATLTGCADGYYATTVPSTGSGSGTALITVTSFMTSNNKLGEYYPDSNSIDALLAFGTPDYTYTGDTTNSRSPVGSEWAVCSNSCPNASSTNTTLSGYSGTFYNGLDKYSSGFQCVADVSFKDGAGTFTMTGCKGSF